MIRDPSDGSVRQKSAPERLTPQNIAERLPSSDAAISGAGTALAPAPTDAKESARLIKSREWIKNYHSSLSSEAVIGKRG